MAFDCYSICVIYLHCTFPAISHLTALLYPTSLICPLEALFAHASGSQIDLRRVDLLGANLTGLVFFVLGSPDLFSAAFPICPCIQLLLETDLLMFLF